jgi:lysyl-tRNA synthetase class 2
VELNEYQQRRLEKAQAMRQEGLDPYPARCERTHTIAEIWASLRFPPEPVQLCGSVQEADGTFDLVAGRDRLQLLGLPEDFASEGDLTFGGWLGISDEGRLILHVKQWGETVEETDFQPLTIPEARELVVDESTEVALVGRLVGGIRTMGRVTFADLQDGSIIEAEKGFRTLHVQLFLNQGVMGKEAYTAFERYFDAGDFAEAHGTLFFTRMAQLSLKVSSVRMLSKALNPPPEKFHGLIDVEKRLRERYADLLANEEVRHRFRIRAMIVRALRRFLDEHGYLEVETPTLQPVYGGAAARPFVTHHNQLDQQLYLRISFELYLKRLLVGMYERVYEIGHDFRNEGVDRTHNPEFTQLEMYQAYADYHDMMRLYEQMIAFTAQEVLGTTQVVYQGDEIDLAPPWQRISLAEAIRQHTGVDIETHTDAASLYQAIERIGGKVESSFTWGKLVDYLLSTYVEPALIQPTFLTDYPIELSPLAKRRPDRPDLVERFEGFIVGFEFCNAFSELNDPIDQEERFLAMGRAYEAGDEEAHPMDEDWLNALMYGMPPAGGLGTGVDRIAMLLTDQTTIREVIIYPHLRQL